MRPRFPFVTRLILWLLILSTLLVGSVVILSRRSGPALFIAYESRSRCQNNRVTCPGGLRLFDPQTGNQFASLVHPQDQIFGLRASPTGQLATWGPAGIDLISLNGI